MLKTGTQHWRTNYQAQIAAQVSHQTLEASKANTKFSTMRSNSTGNVLKSNLIDEEMSKAKSYKNRAYINDAKTGTTDYKFNFG